MKIHFCRYATNSLPVVLFGLLSLVFFYVAAPRLGADSVPSGGLSEGIKFDIPDREASLSLRRLYLHLAFSNRAAFMRK